MNERLTSTLEDYRETIYRIEEQKRAARPRDISEAQRVARSTVTAALQRLAEKRLINYEPYEVVTLSEKGRAQAERLMMRHRIIRNFLESILGVQPDRAENTTCGMEHAIDPEVLERFVCLLAFMRLHSPESSWCLDEFREFAREGAGGRTCRECVETYMNELRTSV